MDLANPIRSAIPSSHGLVLAVLASTGIPLSGRRIAALTDGQLSPKGANLALRHLVAHGIVLAEDQPPSKLYSLNESHLAAESIVALAGMRRKLVSLLKERLQHWDDPPAGGWLFGSAARSTGGVASDIDLLLVRPDAVDDDVWAFQLDELTEDVLGWTGNPCAIIEMSQAEFEAMKTSEARLVDELRADGIPLVGDIDLGRRARVRAS
ncbi:MAG: nucleotidyltransferase domain-containing protein [Candidatus Microthrix subdominans]|jgi:predicted nucleotidyltransferase